jgi:hypothetical protein
LPLVQLVEKKQSDLRNYGRRLGPHVLVLRILQGKQNVYDAMSGLNIL